MGILGAKHKNDFEPYWQDEKDWLCIVEFLPTDSPEARLFAADIIGHLVGMQISRTHARWHSSAILTPAFDFSMSMLLFQPHLATKHSIHKNEVAESEAHPQPPPNEPNAQCIRASGGIVDGDVACWIVAGRQQAGI